MSSDFVKQIMDSAQIRFEILKTFFHQYLNNDDKNTNNLDFKTRIDEYEVEDMSYLHSLHEYMLYEWDYESPIEIYLERKKALRVSRNGEGRRELVEVLKQTYQDDEKNKTNWEKMIGV